MCVRHLTLFFIGGVFMLGVSPFTARAAQSFIYGGSFIGMKMIPGTSYDTYQTALKVGDTFTFRLRVHSPFMYPPTVSVDLSAFGIASPTTTPAGPGSPNYNSDSYYDFGPLIVSAGISDGLKAVPETITDADGGVATGTARIVVDSSLPTVTLSSITFSTTSPRQGDYMYLSGKVDGTGSAARVSNIRMSLTDATGNPVVSPVTGGSTFNFSTNDFNAMLSTSTDGSFSNVPIQLIEFGDIGWISRATNLRIDITGYDEAGNFAANGLTVLIPKTAPPDPCAAPGACASNVLFLPGIEASRLYRPDYAGGTDKLWEPGGDANARDLFMDASGASVRPDIYTKDVVDEAYGTLNIYKSFLADLDAWKNVAHLINDYRAVPYDWRVSLNDVLNYGNQFPDGRLYYSGPLAATSTPYVIQELRRLAASSKTKKVTIVAHSNGGLVAKALLKRLQDTHDPLLDKIDTVIMVAVPQVGTPQAVGAILHGYEQGLPKDWLSVFLTPATARAFVANMPSAYNLLPSAEYFTYVDDSAVEFDSSDFLAEFRARYGPKIHDSAQLKNFITDARRLASSSPSELSYPSVGNVALYQRAETFHATADVWTPPPGIALHEVAGWGEDTLATIRYYEGKKTVCADLSASTCPYYTTTPTLLYEPKEVVEGDGTVLVPSALWTLASTTRKYWVDLDKYNNELPQSLYHLDRKHADILEIPSLRNLIYNILTNSTSTLPQFIYTSQPAATSNERLRFVLHSPLHLSATDNLGNVVSSTTSAIPGGRWKRYGEVQVLTVPKHIPITLALAGIAPGSFTLDMQEIDGHNTVVASSTLSAIPSATSTRATMTLADGTVGHASPLRVDYDGNGTTDFSLQPKAGRTAVFDLTPPEVAIALDPLSQRLQVVGFDDLSATTVSTTATSSTVTDEAGNTLEIVFKKSKREKGELKLEIQELRYNGTSAGVAPRNALQYEWSADKAGNVSELEQEARAGLSKTEAHYSAKKNATKIEEEKKGGDNKKTLLGLVVIGLKTEKGNIIIDY